MYLEEREADVVMSNDIVVTPVELPVTITFEKLEINTTMFRSTEHFILQTVAEYEVVVIPGLNMVVGPTSDSSNYTKITVVLHSKFYFF